MQEVAGCQKHRLKSKKGAGRVHPPDHRIHLHFLAKHSAILPDI
jgi:hypothetical protein